MRPFPFGSPLAKVRLLGWETAVPSGGLLFSDYFLRSGVEDLAEWRAQTSQELRAVHDTIRTIMDSADGAAGMNESETERFVIDPLLDLLGWTDRLTQQNLSAVGRTDVPDYLLFQGTDELSKARSELAQNRRYRLASAFLEGKAWQVPLDRAAGGSAPSTLFFHAGKASKLTKLTHPPIHLLAVSFAGP